MAASSACSWLLQVTFPTQKYALHLQSCTVTSPEAQDRARHRWCQVPRVIATVGNATACTNPLPSASRRSAVAINLWGTANVQASRCDLSVGIHGRGSAGSARAGAILARALMFHIFARIASAWWCGVRTCPQATAAAPGCLESPTWPMTARERPRWPRPPPHAQTHKRLPRPQQPTRSTPRIHQGWSPSPGRYIPRTGERGPCKGGEGVVWRLATHCQAPPRAAGQAPQGWVLLRAS